MTIRPDAGGIETACAQAFAMRFRSGQGLPIAGVEDDVVRMRHRGHAHALRVARGSCGTDDGLALRSDAAGRLVVRMGRGCGARRA